MTNTAYKGYDNTKNLSLVTSGPIPPNPSELLGSVNMKNFLDEMREKFDIIILDSSPINIVTDSAVLSRLSDGVVIVIEAGATEIHDAIICKNQLEKVNANILGVVMNKVPTSGKAYYTYRYEDYLESEDLGRRHRRKKKRKAK